MLFTLGLLLLLTPFPSSETTTNQKRDARGSNVTKTNTVLTLLKPKTTSKQIANLALKPNPVNTTVLPTSGSNQKPTTASPTKTTKTRLSIAVNQTTSAAAAVKAAPTSIIMNKDKYKVNQTTSKENPAPTGAPRVQSTSTKAPSTSKITKIKLQHSANPSPSPKPSSTSGGKTIQLISVKNVPVNNSKTVKNKTTATANQTTEADHRPSNDENSKEHPASTTHVHNVPSKPAKDDKASESTTDKNKATPSANHISSTPSTTIKEKPVPSQPIKVVISDGCDSSHAKEQELTLKPGAPLLMTHKISLVPGGCTGECEAEMADLKGRVARLEKEMSFLLGNCLCSANCPNDCSGNGKCEKGKCICHQGFMGPDCSKCAQGAKCSRESNRNEKEKEKNTTIQEKKNITKVDNKGLTERFEDKATDTKVGSNAKEGHVKLQDNKKTSDNKFFEKTDRSEQEARKGKTQTKNVSPTNNPKPDQKKNDKEYLILDNIKDDPLSNATQGNKRKTNGTTKIETNTSQNTSPKKNKKEHNITGKSTLAEKNNPQSSEKKQTKTDKPENKNEQPTENKKTPGVAAKEKVVQKNQHVTNTTNKTTERTNVFKNKTEIHNTSYKMTGGLGSMKVQNVSSHSFTVMWLAPQGMFKNFTVIRKEPLTESDKGEEELEVEAAAWNSTEVQHESTNLTVSSSKTAGFKGKSETKRISMVLPGNVRSVEFSNLRADTHYSLQIYGTAADRRSKIHRVTAITGPKPPTELVFSNVTENSVAVSWTKPKTVFTGFKVTYINKATGKSRYVSMSSQQSHIVLSELSAGSSYTISVTTVKGRAQSDELTSVITTVPAPPTHLQVNNVTDTRAVLQWTPSLGKVDSFIINYESSKTPNVTVTVMLSGNSAQYQLKGLQRGTLYKVKVLSQKGSLKSVAISSTFTTANVVKASEVGARSAVITWRTPVVYHSYRVIYQVAGEEAKEVILEPTFTEYKLTGLIPLSRYTILVQGEKNERYKSLVTSQFITGKVRFPFPTECSQELLNGALESGEVDIYPQGKEGQAVRVYCDMETDGGGWTVFQRRTNGKTDFYRTWSDYKAGFGNLSEEFWLGNELLHNLTSMGPVGLRVDIRSGNETVYAHYTNFSIASEEKNYILTVSGYTGTAGDSMRYHNGRPFSTRDKDPDPLGIHCAKAYMGGWWYKNCYKVNLNGLYGTSRNNQGVVWIDWKGKDFSIPFTEMKFRPSRFSPATHG